MKLLEPFVEGHTTRYDALIAGLALAMGLRRQHGLPGAFQGGGEGGDGFTHAHPSSPASSTRDTCSARRRSQSPMHDRRPSGRS